LVENLHQGGILRRTIAPAPALTPDVAETAQAWARRLLERLEYVGVLAIELFEVSGRLLANEFAPRVHNSGHWSMDGAETSQFENHLRAILGLPLGATDIIAPTTMVNLIGSVPPAHEVLAIPGAHLHDYDKEPRAGRKVGHINIRQRPSVDFADAVRRAEELASAALLP
jgi:5-(carboxyamino)imidazole ribonucleotide synthase